jgi:hypothetical protein
MSSAESSSIFLRPSGTCEPAFDPELLCIASTVLNPAMRFAAAPASTGRTHILRMDGKVFGLATFRRKSRFLEKREVSYIGVG